MSCGGGGGDASMSKNGIWDHVDWGGNDSSEFSESTFLNSHQLSLLNSSSSPSYVTTSATLKSEESKTTTSDSRRGRARRRGSWFQNNNKKEEECDESPVVSRRASLGCRTVMNDISKSFRRSSWAPSCHDDDDATDTSDDADTSDNAECHTHHVTQDDKSHHSHHYSHHHSQRRSTWTTSTFHETNEPSPSNPDADSVPRRTSYPNRRDLLQQSRSNSMRGGGDILRASLRRRSSAFLDRLDKAVHDIMLDEEDDLEVPFPVRPRGRSSQTS